MKASLEQGQQQQQQGQLAAAAAGREPDARWTREGTKPETTEAERLRTRERLEATLAGLAELEFLRQRQELRIKRLLAAAPVSSPAGICCGGETPRGGEGPEVAPRSLEEKFLEENILLLRRQLNCLRRRDAGLLNQLQELDKQISDLRLDVEKTADERLDADSRPSSGFYELSDGASGSLSNSSNSVFSECLSSCHSSTCFCNPLEASLSSSDGRPSSADFVSWLEHNKGSQHGDLSVGTVSCSPSTLHSDALDIVAVVHPKYQCDLVSKNGNDVYRYPSPLHAVAVQSPMFLLPVTSSPSRDEEENASGHVDVYAGPERSLGKKSDPCPPPSSHSESCPLPSRKMDGYILSLVQKKAPSIRTNKPRTNLNADPAKGILRHGSLCLRQMSNVAPGHTANVKDLSQPFPHSSGTGPALDSSAFSPIKPHSREIEHLEIKKKPIPALSPPNADNEQSKPSGRTVQAHDVVQCPVTKSDVPKESGQPFWTCLKESPGRHITSLKEKKAVQLPKKLSFKSNGMQSGCSVVPAQESRLPAEFRGEGSSSQSLEEGLPVKAQFLPARPQTVRLHRGSRGVKPVRSSAMKLKPHLVTGLENGPQAGCERTHPAGRKCHFLGSLDTNKKARKAPSRGKKSVRVQPEAGLLTRQSAVVKPVTRPHGHSRDPVVAKPKHKRADYRHWKLSVEVSYEEALRRARRARREAVGAYSQVPHPYLSPYAYAASDSEYSAECESLFHSTVVDTSEDERSNYTTNCFGDSESSLSGVDFVGESPTSSDSDESGCLLWSQFVQTLPIQAVGTSELQGNTAKAFVKIKASHNLKKKILRFRSGSLKLMTTV